MLAPAVRALTFAERARWFQEHSLECAAREVQRAEDQLACRGREESLWPHLEDLAGRLSQLSESLQMLLKRRAAVAAVVEAEAEATERQAEPALHVGQAPPAECLQWPLTDALRRRDEALGNLEDRLKDIRRQLEEKRREQETLSGQLNDLRPLIAAKQQKRWWTGSWWWATIQGNVLTKGNELQAQLEQVEKALKDLDNEAQTASTAQDQIRSQYQTERQRLVEAEVARRQAATDDEEAALRQAAPAGAGQMALGLPGFVRVRSADRRRSRGSDGGP